MDLLEAFRHFTATGHLISPGDPLLLAVSGGVDSVVLCELCHRAGFDFRIAHCNFQLRGANSDRDEQFVRQLAARYGKEFLVRKFDTELYAATEKVSVQVAARELRYAWFREVAGPVGRIVTAHHLDDNIETLLMNFFKGTGIAGLRAMLPRQGSLVRPLLFAEKSDLLQFAINQQLAWVEDGSNASDKYTRNYFRHQVIPLVQQLYPAAMMNLAHNIDRFRDIEILYRQSVDHHKSKLLEYRGDEIHIPVEKLKKAAPLHTLIYEIIHTYGFPPNQVTAVIDLLDSDTGKFTRSATHRILKNRNWLIISPLQTSAATTILIESAGQEVVYGDGILSVEWLPVTPGLLGSFSGAAYDPGIPSGSTQTALAQPGPAREPRHSKGSGSRSPEPQVNLVAHLDGDSIQFPLLLRKWKPGDYFYPLGLRKKKKLGRFFIDNKLSIAGKEKIWVIEMNKKIIWVVGLRIDDRFRITPQTRQALVIKTKPGMA